MLDTPGPGLGIHGVGKWENRGKITEWWDERMKNRGEIERQKDKSISSNGCDLSM